jgi:type VI protein secretion system component Hcp
MKRTAIFSTLFTLVGLAAGNLAHAQMYMRAEAPKQGTFKAAVAAPSSVGNGYITVTSIDIGNKPIKVTKPTDASSPEFVEAAAEKEEFTTVSLKFATKDKEGKVTVYMMITLTGAVISDLKQSNSTDVISFNYLKMTTEQTPVTPTPVVTPATTIKPVATPLVRKG